MPKGRVKDPASWTYSGRHKDSPGAGIKVYIDGATLRQLFGELPAGFEYRYRPFKGRKSVVVDIRLSQREDADG